LAESLYRNNQFTDAITSYEQLAGSGGRFRNTTEFRSINFNLGYAYLKAGNYEQAEKSFDSYMKSGDKLYYDEAAVRLGDSYFLQKRYLRLQIATPRQDRRIRRYTFMPCFRGPYL
jgi:tetratricopeptide (TPR) repeat protein